MEQKRNSISKTKLYETIGELSNEKLILGYLKAMAKVERIDKNKMQEYFEKNEEATIRFNVDLEETKDKKEARFILIDTSYSNGVTGEPIYISFFTLGDRGYLGARVGSKDTLIEFLKDTRINHQPSYNERHGLKQIIHTEPDKNVSKEDVKETQEMMKEQELDILSKCVIEFMKVPRSWQGIHECCVNRYLNAIKHACEHRIKDGVQTCGMLYEQKTGRVLINSGLIDKRCNDIYIIGDYIDGELINLEAEVGKSAIVERGFTPHQVSNNNLPFKFYVDVKETQFTDDIDLIDISDEARLTHIVEERKGRFPSIYADYATENLARTLKESILYSMKLVRREYLSPNYMYDYKRDCIQFILPLYLSNDVTDKPDVAILLREKNGLYQLTTMITYEMAEIDAKTYSREPIGWAL